MTSGVPFQGLSGQRPSMAPAPILRHKEMSIGWRLGLSWVLGLAMVAEAGAQEPAAKFAVELEAGATWQSYNDVQIPNDARGTRLWPVRAHGRRGASISLGKPVGGMA